MSIWGDQWVCLCGWHNVFVRKSCRNCRAPRELATVETESAMQVLERFSSPTEPERSDADGKTQV